MNLNKSDRLTIKTERSKNYINKKNNSYLLENRTEKSLSKTKKNIHNQSLVQRINTEQKLYKLNFSKLLNKKIIKCPTSFSIKGKIIKDRSYSYKMINKKITIQTKNILI